MNKISFKIRFILARLENWYHYTLPWTIAWLLPRKVALYCFVRVFSIRGDCPPEYSETYKMWENHGTNRTN